MDWYQLIKDIIGYFTKRNKKNYKYVKIGYLRENYPRINSVSLEGKEFMKDRGRALTKEEYIFFKQNYGDKVRFERFRE